MKQTNKFLDETITDLPMRYLKQVLLPADDIVITGFD